MRQRSPEGGGEVLPHMIYMDMCRREGSGFQANGIGIGIGIGHRNQKVLV